MERTQGSGLEQPEPSPGSALPRPVNLDKPQEPPGPRLPPPKIDAMGKNVLSVLAQRF